MRPSTDVDAMDTFECQECGSRFDDPATLACEDCGGDLLNIGAERDL